MSTYSDEPMSTMAWFWTLLVLAIPVLNILMYIIWACGVGNWNRVTFCRASILWAVVGLAIYSALILTGASKT